MFISPDGKTYTKIPETRNIKEESAEQAKNDIPHLVSQIETLLPHAFPDLNFDSGFAIKLTNNRQVIEEL